MIQIQALNENGIKAFRQLIEDRKSGKEHSINQILSNQSNLERTIFNGQIDPNRIFEDRFDLAAYLSSILQEYGDNKEEYGIENRNEFGKSAGLWSWIALVYFDQLSTKIPKDSANYIFSPQLGFRNFRHSVFTPFDLYKRWGADSRMFISDDIQVMGQIWESALSRHYLMSCAPAVRLMIKLYSDHSNNGIAKPKASSQPSRNILKNGKPSGAGYGSVERFSRVFQRLKLTYHVQNLSPDALLDLMGKEFKQWVE